MLLGAHVSIAGGLTRAVDEARELRCEATQIFSGSKTQWRQRELGDDEVRAYRRGMRDLGVERSMIHDSYLINLASSDRVLWKRSLDAFLDEMNRCARLGIGALVMHPGSHRGAGEAAGIRNVVRALSRAMKATRRSGVRILLETTAGQGDCLGARFEHLAEIMAGLGDDPRLRVCFDTCHVFAAGYDLRTRYGLETTLSEFDRTIGLERLSLFHLNDSKGDLGSRVDRHEHIGKGKIGASLFRTLVRARRFRLIPKVIETPGGVEGGPGDKRNLDLLFSYARGDQ